MSRKYSASALLLAVGAMVVVPGMLPGQILPGGAISQFTTPSVTVVGVNTLNDTHFNVTFAGVPPGFGITNQTYMGWCPDFFGFFGNNNGSTGYTLFSTGNPGLLPVNAQSPNWNMVNWVLNNESLVAGAPPAAGGPNWAVQQVVWRLLKGSYADPGVGYPLPEPYSDNLYNAAITHGSFVPVPGQTVGVLMYVDGIYPDGSANEPPVPGLPLNGQPNVFQEILIEVPLVGLTCVSTGTGTVGVPYTGSVAGVGGFGGPYTFSNVSGLPPGLTMDINGNITGTPTQAGTFTFTVTVTDKNGNSGTGTCQIKINPPVTASCVVINAVQGVPITPVTMTASGGAGGPYTFSATGLPAGLTMSSGGTISGTPQVSGTFNYTVTITDSAGNKGTVNCSVTVNPPPSASCVSITAVQGVAITPVTMTATGGVGGPYTFTATGLPAGLSISPSGTISGTPTVSGTFNYTVTIKDAAGNTGTVNCSVTVSPPACLSPLTPVTYNVHEDSSHASEIVWFNSHLTKLSGTIPTTDFQLFVTAGQITFDTLTLNVPNGVITFSSSATCAQTAFDTGSNTWLTTVPLSSAAKADEIFSAGLAYLLPPNFSQNVSNITWKANVASTAPGVSVTWQYGISNWLTQHNGSSFPVISNPPFVPDYNAMQVDGAHGAPVCYGSGSDHAGAPEFSGRQNVLTGGGSGGGGSNWTGSWSSTPSKVLACVQ
ncbi:MAG: hypothetical protein C5B51_08340 [Terriglobia bacterium]|nr:MAG: hypothetical protein C5B51_08340 [Terriglobia bacterium]